MKASNGVAEGKEAVRKSPDNWREIGEKGNQEISAESQKRISQLEAEGIALQVREKNFLAEIHATQLKPISVQKLSLAESVLSLFVALPFIWVAYKLAEQTLPLISGFKEGSVLLALVFALGTAVALDFFLRHLAKSLTEEMFKLWLLFIALIPVLCLVAGTLTMSLLRTESAAAQSALAMMNAPAVEVQGSLPPSMADGSQAIIQRFYRNTGRLGALLMVLAALGMEIVGAIALHEGLSRIFPAWVGIGKHNELRRVQQRMLEIVEEIEWWNKAPEIFHAEFTRGALLELGKMQQKKAKGKEESRALALSIAILISILVFTAVFLLFVSYAFAAESVVVGIDLSTSSRKGEFQQNVEAVERIIGKLKAGSRFVVIPIGSRSFSQKEILDARLNEKKGRFGEKLRAGKQQLVQVWRNRSRELQANAKETDILGVLLKASVLFEETPKLRPVLIVLSDMRLVRLREGYNFEKLSRIDLRILERMEKKGLIPALEGVDVWVLGVHANDVSDLYWVSLRRFWFGFLKKAGANVRAFTPNRGRFLNYE